MKNDTISRQTAIDSVICNTCGYYHPENNTCNVKKCSGYGWGYVTKLDRKYCTSYRKLQETSKKEQNNLFFKQNNSF